WHQPRAAHQRRGAFRGRPQCGQLPVGHHGAGSRPPGTACDRAVRGRTGQRRGSGCASSGGLPPPGRRMSAPRTGGDPLALVRGDLAGFGGYASARTAGLDGDTWLNANESPWPNAADADGRLRRYPDPQPEALRDALARLYGCSPSQLLAGRGSDEAIDLLVRALCRPGGDAVLVTPPTFGMYAVSARLHGTPVIEVPLLDTGDTFAVDFDAIERIVAAHPIRIVFLCSPGNPTG